METDRISLSLSAVYTGGASSGSPALPYLIFRCCLQSKVQSVLKCNDESIFCKGCWVMWHPLNLKGCLDECIGHSTDRSYLKGEVDALHMAHHDLTDLVWPRSLIDVLVVIPHGLLQITAVFHTMHQGGVCFQHGLFISKWNNAVRRTLERKQHAQRQIVH